MTTSTSSDETLPSLKSRIKQVIKQSPAVWGIYWATKQQLLRLARLRYFLHDAANVYRAMYWSGAQVDRVSLGAELLFQYHKLEKGMSMPGPVRFFGRDPAYRVAQLVVRWKEAGLPCSDPVYVGANEALVAFRQRIAAMDAAGVDDLRRAIDRALSICNERDATLSTPRLIERGAGKSDATGLLWQIAQERRSVRNFSDVPVPVGAIEFAVRVAQLSPSACNRQAVVAYSIQDRKTIDSLLAYQNGNRGFGHAVPSLVVIAADERCFFDATERHEPFVDGGLFAMSFLFGLQAQGVSSCCLNWCVPPNVDREVHRRFNIPSEQRITMLIAVGFAANECVVPRSPRRDLSEVLLRLP